MKQTGLITKYPLPQDYVLGGETAVKGKIRTSDWKEYLPAIEKQYSINFDTLSCTSFSFNNVVESQLNFMIAKGELSADSIKWLTDNGYIENGKVNLSDRFLAVMSGTTERGNDFRTVAECARTVGLIPEKDFPLGGNSFAEYHNKSLITQQMKDKASQFLKRIKISWEWLFFDSALGFNEGVQVSGVIQETPVQIGITTPATHATMLFDYNKDTKWFKVFDTYDPFFFENYGDAYNPQIGLRVMCSAPVIIAPTPVPSEFTFKNTLVVGSKGNDVIQLQRVLISEGLMKVGLDTGNFGPITLQAVKNFQMKYGIRPTGNVGPITIAKLNSILDGLKKKPKYQISEAGLALIMQFEGCILHPYKDQSGYWTIGWGNRYINGVEVTHETPPLTQEQADNLFLSSLGSYQEAVNKSVERWITQSQYDALVSLCYNIGTGAFAQSSLIKRVNDGTITRADFLQWVKSRDQKTKELLTLPGLVKRRNKEADVYGLA